jgi:hypothetical protein
MGAAVDHHATTAADAFPAVVLKGDGLFTLRLQIVIHNIEHFEKRGLWRYIRGLILCQVPCVVRAMLPPNEKRKIHNVHLLVTPL